MWDITDEELVLGQGPIVTEQPQSRQPVRHFLGRFFRGVYQSHRRSEHLGDRVLENGVVRASENDDVHGRVAERSEVLMRYHESDLAVGPALFGQGDEQRATGLDNFDVTIEPADGPSIGAARDRALGADHTDLAGKSGRHGGKSAGFDHADDRDLAV